MEGSTQVLFFLDLGRVAMWATDHPTDPIFSADLWIAVFLRCLAMDSLGLGWYIYGRFST